MSALNRCRLYLQVINLSDIVSADGKRILQEAKQGHRLEGQHSNLQWSVQGRPSQVEWSIWSYNLSQLETRGRLAKVLGDWIAPGHQTWNHLYNLLTQEVYMVKEDSAVEKFSPIIRSDRRTRSSLRPWYDISQPEPSGPAAVPCTIIHNKTHQGNLFQVECSTSAPQGRDNNTRNNTAPQLYPASFLQLLGSLASSLPLLSIATAAYHENLTITSTGTFNKHLHLGNFDCTFQAYKILIEGSGTPQSCKSANRSSLIATMAVLYILHWAEGQNPIPSGKVTIICNQKQAMKAAFDTSPVGVKQVTQPNHDIIQTICHLHTNITLVLCPMWVYSPVVHCNHHTSEGNGVSLPTIGPFMSTTDILQQGQPITSSIPQLLRHQYYYRPLQEKLMKDNKWMIEIFNRIDWQSYGLAIAKFPRSQQISITKLSHQLWNTNCQNAKYYGESDQCPICAEAAETLTHLYTCPSNHGITARQAALTTFQDTISKTTPPLILNTIIAGITDKESTILLSSQDSSISPHLTKAINKQTSIGWNALLRGHIGKVWKKAFVSQSPARQKPKVTSEKWATQLIISLWQYTKAIWACRNEVVHNKTAMSRISKTVQNLQRRAAAYYE
jgi:hypothetical protein